MKNIRVKELLSLLKKTLRLNIIAGFTIAVLFFNLSFILPHIDKLLGILYIPGLIYGIYYYYTINKLSARIDPIVNDLREEKEDTPDE